MPIPNPGVSFYPLIFPSSPHQQEVWRARCAPSTARAVRARRCPIVRQLPAALPPLRYSLLSQFFPPPPPAPERFPGRATVSHGRPQLGGRKFAGARGSTCADPEDQQAENGIEIIEIHRAGRTEGLAPVGGRPPLLAASEPLFQYS